ncbi:hypothetical protein JCM10207_006131 [Rhodosporidiobolus poonsookiae]
MSWRASPSRPAPPVTSGSAADRAGSTASAAFDALFAGPSSSSSASAGPSRTLSSSTSAYSLLSKKMAEIEDEDDRMSIRSGRSTVSRLRGGGSGSGDSTARPRSRADSTASSVRTARGWSGSAIDEDGDAAMRDEDRAGGEGKGKEVEVDPAASPASAKRARLRPPPASDAASIRSRRSSRLLAPSALSLPSSSASSAQPTLSTTTADDLMPSMKTKPHRAASIASTRARPPRPTPRPSLPPADSSSTLRAQPSFSPSIQYSPSLAEPSTSCSASTSLSTSPIEPLPPSVAPSTSHVSSRRSWFSRPAIDPAATAEQPAPEPAPPSDPPASTAAPVPASPASQAPPSANGTDGVADGSSAPTRTLTSSASRGWLSLLSRSKPSNLDLAAEAAGPAEAMDVDAAADSGALSAGAEVREEGEETPPATPRAARADDSTLRGAPPAADYESATLTPKPPPSNNRASWFTWGRSASTEVVPGISKQHASDEPPRAEGLVAEDAVARATAEDGQPDYESALTPEPASATAEGRGWLSLRSLWGGGATAEELLEQRRREAWALKLAAKNSQLGFEDQQQKAIEAPPVLQQQEEAAEEEEASTASPAQPLRHKPSASWSLFSRTPAGTSVSPAAKSGFSLRGPLANLGVASSAASTRSRTSSRADTTAPSSPQLRPQSDQGPVKPLTGSIRNTSPRQRSSSTFDPPPAFDNLVLPTFNDTFLRPPRSFEPKKSTLNRAVSVVSAYLFHRPAEDGTGTPSPLQQAQHAAGVKTDGMQTEMVDDPAERLPKVLEALGEASARRREKVKRVAVIGVSGWYTSSPMVRSVLGEQTGTSVKFATMMHDAVHSYLESHDTGSFNIQAIALEGQGTVQDRVDKLYNQLVGRKEWVQAITMADAVFLATHSQGTVVSTQLIARMLDQGLIVGTQTHLLAMCGIAQGPFIYLHQSLALAPYFNYVESAPARELFEYQNPESVAAIKFVESLRLVLNAGVKLTAIGSINDQVVPLYSALFSGVSHPSILRAVYIDSDAFRASDFLANLVIFCARLRNAGLSDHDLAYHLSEALAGALTGVGHSKIYEEEEVFLLAVRYHFETTALTEAPTHLDTQAPPPPLEMSFNPRDRRNPYLLTWSLRGIIEDPQVRELFEPELNALREAYDGWRPQTKVLKETKLKLEGIRMSRKGKL